MFESITPAPPDAILGLSEAFAADARPGKVNLAVGVYKDATGKTPILAAVKEAERRLLESETTKSYLPITGPAAYGQQVRALLFGADHALATDGCAVTSATPGGTGALRVTADYLAANHPGTAVWMTTPTWANHPSIFKAAGVTVKRYPYLDASGFALDFDGMLAALKQVPAGDVVLLHGCCHNPTGVDPSPTQWEAIASVLEERGALPLLDFAYQGFGDGLEEDAAGLRAVTKTCGALLICSSFSKNFGLYNERVGALTAVAGDAQQASAVLSRIKLCIRRNYSNPPAHGLSIVRTVLEDPALTGQWADELATMRSRIAEMRKALRAGLDARGVSLSPEGNGFVTAQKGMFTMSGLSPEAVASLREDHGIYVVGDGRVNVAGITPGNLDTLCDSLSKVGNRKSEGRNG